MNNFNICWTIFKATLMIQQFFSELLNHGSKKQKPSDSTTSTLISGANDNDKLNSFNISISNVKLKNNNVTFNTSQTQIPISDTKQALKTISKSKLKQFDLFIFYECDDIIDQLIPTVRGQNGGLFIIVFSNNANESAIFREKLFNLKCNIITKDISSISRVNATISNAKSNYLSNVDNKSTKFYTCPCNSCGIIHYIILEVRID